MDLGEQKLQALKKKLEAMYGRTFRNLPGVFRVVFADQSGGEFSVAFYYRAKDRSEQVFRHHYDRHHVFGSTCDQPDQSEWWYRLRVCRFGQETIGLVLGAMGVGEWYNNDMAMTLTSDEYAELVALARKGTSDQQALDQLLLVPIEQRNSIARYLLVVQWQDATAVIPVTSEFPASWPPNLRMTIEQLNVPISRQQVEDAVALRANKPVSILVTPDPNGSVGWSTLDQWFAVRT